MESEYLPDQAPRPEWADALVACLEPLGAALRTAEADWALALSRQGYPPSTGPDHYWVLGHHQPFADINSTLARNGFTTAGRDEGPLMWPGRRRSRPGQGALLDAWDEQRRIGVKVDWRRNQPPADRQAPALLDADLDYLVLVLRPDRYEPMVRAVRERIDRNPPSNSTQGVLCIAMTR